MRLIITKRLLYSQPNDITVHVLKFTVYGVIRSRLYSKKYFHKLKTVYFNLGV